MGRESQLVGAFGEKAVETELLRRGWRTSNFNASITNAADYDIVAIKDDRIVLLRVKACGRGLNKFQFSFRPGQEIAYDHFPDFDFTILVQTGKSRSDDRFYILPTKVLRKQISQHRRVSLKQKKRDGTERSDAGHWSMNLSSLNNGEVRLNYGLEHAQRQYLCNWESLEVNAKSVPATQEQVNALRNYEDEVN